MTCPDPVPGSVTNESGLTGLVDAYSYEQGAPYQGQLWAWCTDKAGACAHFRANQTVKLEHSVRTIQVKGWNGDATNWTPLPYTTGTFDVTKVYDGSGTAYVGDPPVGAEVHVPEAYYRATGSNCQYSDQKATAGTFTWTAVWDDTLPPEQQVLTGSYDLTFPAGHFTGEFTAPRCVTEGCPARPSKSSCVS